MAQVPSKHSASEQLHALFREDLEWSLQEYPEQATFLGDHRYDHRLTDLSFEAIERRKAHQREMLARLKNIHRSELSGQDVISFDLFLYDKRIAVDGQRFPLEVFPLNQVNGLQLDAPALAYTMPFQTVQDYEHFLARLAAFSNYVDQTIALMQRGIETKYVLPAVPLRSIPAQIEGQIVDDPVKSPFYHPFEKFPAEISGSDRTRLTAEGRKAITESVVPALKRLHKFIKNTYLPACTQQIAATSLPDGEAFYAYMIQRETSTRLSPKEIHEIGQREVARIRAEMEAIIQQVGFKGSFQEFLTFLRTDPRFYYTKPEDLVTGYRDLCKRADAELPKLFAELPRNTYGVRAFPDYEAPAQTTARYFPGAADSSRAGYYLVNTYKLETRPKYEMEALTLHESVPGHHLQISRAFELKGLPEFRQHAAYNAYVEGWALYAESLGTEMGFYTDPYSRFGQLTYEMWRACRLVVDTGIHSFGWTRQQAIDFMKNNTAKSENDIVVEVDRYIVWPGQALGYKLGELKIKELRARAQNELGTQFNLRKFHNALLDDGALPLEVLEQRMIEWIAQQKRSGQAAK